MASGGNIFAALAKSKSSKKSKPKEQREDPADRHAELESAIFSQSGTGLSNWADDSEDEDWGATQSHTQGEGWSEVMDAVHDSDNRFCAALANAALEPHHATLMLQAKGGVSAAAYGFDQQQDEAAPESESEEEEEVGAARSPSLPRLGSSCCRHLSSLILPCTTAGYR